MKVMLAFLLAFSARTAFAECQDLGGGLRIVSKINQNTYLADMWGMLSPKVRFVLKTNRTTFNSNGTVMDHIWIDVPTENPETTTVTNPEGHQEKFDVAHETTACTVHGANAAAEWKKNDAEQAVEDKKAQEEYQANEDSWFKAQREATAEREQAAKDGKLEVYDKNLREKKKAEISASVEASNKAQHEKYLKAGQ